MLSEVRLATMQQGEGLKEEGIHHIDLCSLEGLRALTKRAASRRTLCISFAALQFHLSLNGNKLSRFCSKCNMNTQLAVDWLTLSARGRITSLYLMKVSQICFSKLWVLYMTFIMLLSLFASTKVLLP